MNVKIRMERLQPFTAIMLKEAIGTIVSRNYVVGKLPNPQDYGLRAELAEEIRHKTFMYEIKLIRDTLISEYLGTAEGRAMCQRIVEFEQDIRLDAAKVLGVKL